MFESAQLGHAITKQAYARQVPKLREALLDSQYDLFQICSRAARASRIAR